MNDVLLNNNVVRYGHATSERMGGVAKPICVIKPSICLQKVMNNLFFVKNEQLPNVHKNGDSQNCKSQICKCEMVHAIASRRSSRHLAKCK